MEWLGNLLPHPVTLFALFALGVVVLSGIAAAAGLAVDDPRPSHEGEVFAVRSLMTGEGVRWMAQRLVTNFTGFVPLGTVLVALLGPASPRLGSPTLARRPHPRHASEAARSPPGRRGRSAAATPARPRRS